MDGIDAGGDLGVKAIDEGGGDVLEEGVEKGGLIKKEGFGVSEILGGAALDHVRSEGPWCAAEAEDCVGMADLVMDDADGVGKVGEAIHDAVGVEVADGGGVADREVHADAAGVAEMVRLAEGFGDDEDIGKNDSGIEWEAAQGLEGDFCGEFRGFGEGEKIVALLEGAVFGEVAPGLAHDPCWGAFGWATVKGVEKALSRSHDAGAVVELRCGFRASQSWGLRKKSVRRASGELGAMGRWYSHLARGGSDIRMDSVRPPLWSPNSVPRS